MVWAAFVGGGLTFSRCCCCCNCHPAIAIPPPPRHPDVHASMSFNLKHRRRSRRRTTTCHDRGALACPLPMTFVVTHRQSFTAHCCGFCRYRHCLPIPHPSVDIAKAVTFAFDVEKLLIVAFLRHILLSSSTRTIIDLSLLSYSLLLLCCCCHSAGLVTAMSCCSDSSVAATVLFFLLFMLFLIVDSLLRCRSPWPSSLELLFPELG